MEERKVFSTGIIFAFAKLLRKGRKKNGSNPYNEYFFKQDSRIKKKNYCILFIRFLWHPSPYKVIGWHNIRSK